MKITRYARNCFISLLALPLAGLAGAIEPIRIELEFQPDIDNGRQTFAICARCHLPEAWGNDDGSYPQLAGQHVNVLMKQLLDIRSGKRANPTMQPFVQQRTIGGYQNLSDVVAYISTLPMNPDYNRGPWRAGSAGYQQGEEIYRRHCASCHGAMGEGSNQHSFPRLQGQHFSYMQRQARLVRNNLRDVDASMAALFRSLTAEDLNLVLNYVSQLPLPTADRAPSADWRNPDFN